MNNLFDNIFSNPPCNLHIDVINTKYTGANMPAAINGFGAGNKKITPDITPKLVMTRITCKIFFVMPNEIFLTKQTPQKFPNRKIAYSNMGCR